MAPARKFFCLELQFDVNSRLGWGVQNRTPIFLAVSCSFSRLALPDCGLGELDSSFFSPPPLGWAYKQRGLYPGGLASEKKKRFETSHGSVDQNSFLSNI